MERHTTFIDGFRNDDFYEGAEVGQRGNAQGFQAGVLVRFPNVTNSDEPDDKEYLLWGNGNFETGSFQGWSITASQADPSEWVVIFTVALDDGGAVVVDIPWDLDNAVFPMTNRSLFIHAYFDPAGGDPEFGFFVNGVPTTTSEKSGTMIPSTLPPRIGGGIPPVPILPTPTAPFIEPRIAIAGVCYRDSPDTFLGGYFADVFERVQEVDDITQLPDESFLWDNIWSARRGQPNVGPVWDDLIGGAQLVRTGGGDTLQSNAAKAHWWNQ